MAVEVRMRFRTDKRFIAEAKAKGRTYKPFYGTQDVWDATPPAVPGDTWRVTWMSTGALAGYDICCPTCKSIHGWTTAHNCASRKKMTTTNPDGTQSTYYTCAHSGTGSCWAWSGSAEAGTLSASPSLYAPKELGGCGFHGYLTNGVLRG